MKPKILESYPHGDLLMLEDGTRVFRPKEVKPPEPVAKDASLRNVPAPNTQARRVLDALLEAKGEWVNGQYFLRTLYFSQYHAVIFNLENRYGWPIDHSPETDEHGFKSYRIQLQ